MTFFIILIISRNGRQSLVARFTRTALMTNHVHLVIDPGDNPENLGLLMKRVAGRQTRFVNRMEKRSGSLWEGRYKSSPINANEYLLACCRYIELNPVRAGIVEDPGQYRWSSCPVKFLTGTDLKSVPKVWLDLDPFYLSLGNSPTDRAEKYCKWLKETIPESESKLIREAVQRGQLTANRKFSREISEKLGRRVELRGPGRPRNKK